MESAWYDLIRTTISQGKPIGFGGWFGGDIDNTPSSMFWVDSASMNYSLCPLAKHFEWNDVVCVPTYTKAQLLALEPKDVTGVGLCAAAN